MKKLVIALLLTGLMVVATVGPVFGSHSISVKCVFLSGGGATILFEKIVQDDIGMEISQARKDCSALHTPEKPTHLIVIPARHNEG